MDAFQKKGLIFGASVTVTTENLKEVSSDFFIETLSGRGCKAVIFVDLVEVHPLIIWLNGKRATDNIRDGYG